MWQNSTKWSMQCGCNDQSYSCSCVARLSSSETCAEFFTATTKIARRTAWTMAVITCYINIKTGCKCNHCALLPGQGNIILMPKVIDKYVLEDKIGSGQYGQVFRGRHQQTLQVVAIKSIRRDMIKGKFYQLLQNEIKVLKTCDNPHIIKLHALKKTPHNYYLMLEYCNGGDMLAKVRSEGALPEEEVIKDLCQILNAFQILVRHKIMHRDFKLANILLHDGNIKIADFGFAKLLSHEDYATTMLGSPLNMAPEVLGGTKYNNKADIWSIGACIYEMLYGKPPYVASNMVDLAKLIKNKPLVLPSDPPVCQELKDVLRKMLVADVKRRIEWEQLFTHPITHYLNKKRRNEMELQLLEDESLMINTSKCYLKNNLVLQNANEIKTNSEINDYLVDIIRTGRKNSEPDARHESPKIKESHNMSSITRQNNTRLLHFRNIYAFLASVADLIIKKTATPYYQIAGYVVVRKILALIEWLIKVTHAEECGIVGVQQWKAYCQQGEFLQIRDYIENQYEVFSVFNKAMEPQIKKRCLQGSYDPDVKEMIAGSMKEQTYRKYLQLFLKQLARGNAETSLANCSLADAKSDWRLLYNGLKIVDVNATFGSGEQEFDFKGFYDVFERLEEEKMLMEIEGMMVRLQ